MDQQQFPPFHLQGPWQQQGQQHVPPGPQNPQGSMPGPQNGQQPMPLGFPDPQQQLQQPSNIQSPRPQHPQGTPPFATAQTPDINALYPHNPQLASQAQQPFLQPQGQQGPSHFQFPLADQIRMSQGPHHIVQTPGQVPPGAIPQPQQAQNATPASFGAASGPFGHPSPQQTPQPPQIPLPPNTPHSVHGSVQPQHPGPFGLPNHPTGLAQNPTQQGMLPMAPPMAQQPVQRRPPAVPPFPQQSIHVGPPMAPPFQAGPPVRGPAPSIRNVQAAAANARQTHVMFDDEESNREMEALQEEMFNVRMRDAKEATAKDPKAQLSREELERDDRKAKCESFRTREEELLKHYAEERARLRGDFNSNSGQGGGSRRGAGGATPWKQRCFLANLTKPKKEPASNTPPAQSRNVTTTPEQKGRPVPSASNMPGEDEDEGGVALGKQPEARDVNLERSKSPNRSPSRAQRHHRRRDAALSARRHSAGGTGSSRSRGGTERWRRAGMYYASGETQGGVPVQFRYRRRETQS